jgi:hypothetical protein
VALVALPEQLHRLALWQAGAARALPRPRKCSTAPGLGWACPARWWWRPAALRAYVMSPLERRGALPQSGLVSHPMRAEAKQPRAGLGRRASAGRRARGPAGRPAATAAGRLQSYSPEAVRAEARLPAAAGERRNAAVPRPRWFRQAPAGPLPAQAFRQEAAGSASPRASGRRASAASARWRLSTAPWLETSARVFAPSPRGWRAASPPPRQATAAAGASAAEQGRGRTCCQHAGFALTTINA